MHILFRSLLKVLSEICTTLLYQPDIPEEHKRDMVVALEDFNKSVIDHFERK